MTFLKCSTNNLASTAFTAFHQGVERYGTPRRVRTDHGGENIDIWRHMLEKRGDSGVIVGSSTHNERIERLWRDVHRSVLVVFGSLFRSLEAEGNLDSLNEVDMFCLHYVFTRPINEALQSFVEGWNNHAVSTESNQTPNQLLIASVLEQDELSSSSDSDTDEDASTLPFNSETVAVPRCSFQPCRQLYSDLQRSSNSPIPTNDHGKSVYLTVMNVVGTHLLTDCLDCVTS